MPFSGKRLQQRRLQRGFTQAQLAERLGVVDKQLAKWEQQINTPNPEAIARLAQFLGCTTDWLLGLTDEPTGYLQPKTLSEVEWQLIQLYREGELPDLIQRLVRELAHGQVQKDPVMDDSGQTNVAP